MRGRIQGIIGTGSYTPKTHRSLYILWRGMFTRCNSSSNPSYADCTIHQRWLNFQLFCYDIQRMQNWNTGFALDKDLMVLGNREYGPDVCSFVPMQLNNILLVPNRRKNSNPTGVFNGPNGKYIAKLKANGRYRYVGYYDTQKEAHHAYCAAKQAHVRAMAEHYVEVLDPRVYQTLRTWVPNPW